MRKTGEMMIRRDLEPPLTELAGYYPVVLLTGPRQSGKTTICRSAFPDRAYVSLEAPDTRDFATSDPRGFLATYSDGVILDEVQRAPELLSYLQEEVDQRPESGRFILTGSQQFGLSDAVSQSLAGRVGQATLLPLQRDEVTRFSDPPADLFAATWAGSYPRIHDREIPAQTWLADYVATYVERDVRQVLNVGDLLAFSSFLRIAAGRTGQLVNLSSMGRDAGITHKTARSWLSVLEASYIVFRIPAFHVNLRKQIARSPKLHFFDSGLVCYLLGIRSPEELRLHPLRGAIFESWVASEVYKSQVHSGKRPDLFHYRESRGLEVDLLVRRGSVLTPVEAKSSATLPGGAFQSVTRFRERLAGVPGLRVEGGSIIYGGDHSQVRTAGQVVSWRDVGQITADG